MTCTSAISLLAYARKFLGPPKLGSGMTNLFRFSLPLLLGGATTYAWTWFDRAILIPMVTLSQLGAYNVAVTAFGLLNSMPGAISGTLFPYYAKFYPDKNRASRTEDLENAVTKASRYVSFFTIPLSIGLAATALPAATLLAGSSYTDAGYPLAILSVSLAEGCLVRALSEIFVVLGKNRTSGVVTGASALVSVLMGLAIVPHLGILGAYLARGASLLIALSLSIPLLKKTLKLRFDMSAYRSAWITSLLMAGLVLTFQMFFYSKYLLPIYVLVGGLVFILALKPLHAIKQEDLHLISDFLGPRLEFLVKALTRLLGIRNGMPH